ncbi:MAG: exodeoxyribonuclease III [Cocleimonas sp.]|nr:exodeoxyribonuclease III [Cocleimonas sp.]
MNSFKIATWNVNSLRVRLEQVVNWLVAEQPDVLVLQETKMTDDQFPKEDIKAAGYHVVFSGQKTYNGVAILSKNKAEACIMDLPTLDDPQRRILAATINGIRILNLYVVNGSEVGSDKYAYKLDWINKVTEWVADQQKQQHKFIILGDFNIAPTDADVHNPTAWNERILCSTPERQALKKLLGLGFVDSFRQFEQKERVWSWWDYRSGGFAKNRGLRIDLILSSQLLSERCTACFVDKAPRGWERPSDHAPVIAQYRM